MGPDDTSSALDSSALDMDEPEAPLHAIDGPDLSHATADAEPSEADEEVAPAPLDGELAGAFDRIDAAMRALDATVDRHLENHLDNAAAAAEVQRLNADRARLARALDEAEARAARLDEVNRDVSRRLVAAMETIRSVLEG